MFSSKWLLKINQNVDSNKYVTITTSFLLPFNLRKNICKKNYNIAINSGLGIYFHHN